jgi:hypothetical protein
MNTILESIRTMNTRQQAEAYLADKPGHAIKAAYTAWIGRQAPTVAKARTALINIAGAIADRDAIMGAGR